MQPQTLDTFYRCKEWENLLRVLKLERVNEAGELICEHCGKPITRAYDAIGHHKEELTPENVNDANVSLNPANIAFVHHKCHNLIHNKLGYKVRQVFIVYGPPRAGKSTWVRENASPGDMILDIDNIWQCFSGCGRYIKPARLNGVVFKIRDAALDAIQYRVGRWNTAYIIGGYPLQSERERLCKTLGAREVYIEATEAECLARLYQDTSDIPKEIAQDYEGYIKKWFSIYTIGT